MKILLSNDDGIQAIGMAALIRALTKKHTVYVVAPNRQRSSISRSVSIGVPLHAERLVLPEFPNVWACAVDGTPVDCVRLALSTLLPEKVDLCITGINFGYNVGTDTLYSGTAAAAIEAVVDGVGAIAMSNGVENNGKYMDTAGEIALRMVDFYAAHPLPQGAFYNVNVPDVPLSELKGAKQATLSRIGYDLIYHENIETDGRVAYITQWTKQSEPCQDSDLAVSADGYVSITTLLYDNANNAWMGTVSDDEWKRIGDRSCERQ